MKTLNRVLAVGLCTLAWAAPCGAQTIGTPVGGPISIGRVVAVDTARGMMTIQSENTGRALTFYGMDRVPVETPAGNMLSLSQVMPDMHVTVEYAPSKGRWRVGRVLIPGSTSNLPAIAAPPPVRHDLSGAELRALRGRAFNDNDITTQPGIRARISNDITYQPGKKDRYDRDITKKSDQYYPRGY
jgi:hypothetical protein